MNNSQIALNNVEKPESPVVKWKEREAELLKIIESIRGVALSREWSSLKELLFQDDIKRLEKQLQDESLKSEPNPFNLRFIAGQLERAKKYDLTSLETKYRTELSGIRMLLHGKETE